MKKYKKVDAKIDSWAYWKVPEGLTADAPIAEKEKRFEESYEPGFPDIDHSKLDPTKAKYVLVGLNSGNAGPMRGDFGNFHGLKKSKDWRIAAITYGTPVWGAFMTDLVDVKESDSRKVKVSAEDVTNFLKQLDEEGIPPDATLIAMGKSTTFPPLDRYDLGQHSLTYIQHYSSSNNGHWNTSEQHDRIMEITKSQTNK